MDLLLQIATTFIEMSPYILLGVSFVAIFNIFISKDFIIRHTNKANITSIIKTAIFGIPLPLCSCGVIPTAVYLEKNGASKPAVVSFLISTPQTGIDSIIATYGMLGPVFALFRPISALLMGIIGGIATLLFDKRKDKTLPSSSLEVNNISTNKDMKFLQKVINSLRYAFIEFIDDISTQFLFGLIIAGAIAYFVPDDFFATAFEGNEILGMLAIIVFAIPMYVCATASIPIAISLIMKGFSPGIAYVFLVAGPISNAASISILVKVLGRKILGIYLLSVSLSAIAFGFLLNAIFQYFDFDIHSQMKHLHYHSAHFTALDYFFASFFFILLISSIFRKYIFKKKQRIKMGDNIIKYKINGMTCNHCATNVEKALKNIAGVKNVEIILSDGIAVVEGNCNSDEVKKAVENIGYTFVGEQKI